MTDRGRRRARRTDPADVGTKDRRCPPVGRPRPAGTVGRVVRRTERPERPDDPCDGGRGARRDPPTVPAVVRPAVRVVRAAEDRVERLERAVERRWPRLYDLRHAANGVGRLVGPLIGAVLALAILAPLLALLAALGALVDLLGVDVPAVELPDVSLPSVGVPGWLHDVGAVFSAIGGWIAAVASALQWPAIVALVVGGLVRSRNAVRRRAAADRIGRDELLRRLASSLAAVEAAARARGTRTVGAARDRRDR